MINLNELRFGNFINKKGLGLVKVCYSVFESFNTYPIELAAKEYDPILLSDTILKQCGFKRDRNGFVLDDKDSLSFSITKEGEFMPCWKDLPLLRGESRTIKYLHQLQNLYFALTGEELVFESTHAVT